MQKAEFVCLPCHLLGFMTFTLVLYKLSSDALCQNQHIEITTW